MEIFTIKEYNLYQEKYGDYGLNLLNDNEVEYQFVKINHPHDKICRKALDKKKDAVKIINRILNEGEKISASEIEKYTSSYISDELRNSESDVVYKLKNENVFFLIEHQTKIDYSMPYRMLNIGGDADMLAVFDMIREEKLKDINTGRTEGRLQAKIEDIKNMLKEKLPIDLISRITGVSEEEIEKYTKLK